VQRFSRPLAELRDHYTVVVVGSGYGGAIGASRLARAGQSVCLLERGREIHPGQYPNTLLQAADEVQARTAERRYGRPTAMFEFRLGDDISVIVGCGLGGTSLINANVALRAKPWVFEDRWWPEHRGWPSELRDNGAEVLSPYFELAEKMLGSTQYPDDWPALDKVRALQRSAEALGQHVERPPINVTFSTGPNAAGVMQRACVLCGDCVSGCNYAAKNTVLMNYLPDAYRHDAHIFTETEVRFLHRRDGRWVVTFRELGGRELYDAPALSVTADVVVLAAGTLGSTEILLRSGAAGLPVSSKLGDRFSGNGDFIAFAYDADIPVHAVGLGSRQPGKPVGPCITGMINFTNRPKGKLGLLIQDGVIPGALGPILPLAFWAAAETIGEKGTGAKLAHRLKLAASAASGSQRGRMDRTLTYLVMGMDDDRGQMLLEGDELRIEWRGVADRPVFRWDNETLRSAAEALGATYVPNPLWGVPGHRSLVTVHPLGGCAMADVAEHGVVNHKGQVFAGTSGPEVHEGLYVADGSVIPTPLGVNPLLTISALAERTCDLLARDRRWAIDQDGAGS
jgi:cholesterol oxidase